MESSFSWLLYRQYLKARSLSADTLEIHSGRLLRWCLIFVLFFLLAFPFSSRECLILLTHRKSRDCFASSDICWDPNVVAVGPIRCESFLVIGVVLCNRRDPRTFRCILICCEPKTQLRYPNWLQKCRTLSSPERNGAFLTSVRGFILNLTSVF